MPKTSRKKWISKKKKKVNSNISKSISLIEVETAPNKKQLLREAEEHAIQSNKQNILGLSVIVVKVGEITITEEQQKQRDWLRYAAISINMYRELHGLITINSKESFSLLRKDLFFVVGQIIEYGAIDYPIELNKEIYDIGFKLNKTGGLRNISDPLIWLFIPDCLHEIINSIWQKLAEI